MLAQTIASYTEKSTHSKISVEGAMLVGTNGTTTLRKIPEERTEEEEHRSSRSRQSRV
jgi:hypothetical protein